MRERLRRMVGVSVVKMLAPSKDSEQGFEANPEERNDTTLITLDQEIITTEKQDNPQIVTETEIEVKVVQEEEEEEEEEESESDQYVVTEEGDRESSPEIPQKVAFKESNNEQEREESTSEVVADNKGEGDKEEIIIMEEIPQEPSSPPEELIQLQDEVKQVEERESENVVQKKTPTEGDVVEILNNLEFMKTPEPDEVVSDGIVRASFVDFNMDEPVEEQSEDEGEEEEDDEGEKEGKEDESMEIFQMNDQITSHPELQKIREEQVRKWLKFEEENPTKESNGHNGDLSEEMEEGDIEGDMTVDGLHRRVRFLTDTEGNLLISVFMSKLVHLILFFLKIASGGYIDLKYETGSHSHPLIAQAQVQAPVEPNGTRFLKTSQGTKSLALRSQTVVDIETDYGTNCRLTMNDTHLSLNSSNPATVENFEDNSMVSSNGMQSNPALVVSPPSLDLQVNGIQSDPQEPSAPPMNDDHLNELEQLEDDGDDKDNRESPSIVLVTPAFPKEPPKEKPPAPPIDDIDEGCNSSDETLSVSSCNSMIEILPANNMNSDNNNNNNNNQYEISNAKNASEAKILELDNILNLDSQPPTNQVTNQMTELEEITESEEKPNQEKKIEEGHHDAPVPTFLIDKSEGKEDNEKVEDGKNDDSSRPSSVIIHDFEEPATEETEDQPPTDAEIIKLPNVDENNNIVEENIEVPPEPENDLQEQEEELKPVMNLHLEENGDHSTIPDLRMSQCSSSSDGEEDRFISALSEQLPSVKDLSHVKMQPHLEPVVGSEEEREQQMVSLCIQEEHISSVALTIAKWESMSKAQSTENLASTPLPHLPVTKCLSSPCPKMVKNLASAIEQVNPVPVVPLNTLPIISSPVQQHVKTNGETNHDEKPQKEESRTAINGTGNNDNNNGSNNVVNSSKVVSVAVNNALNTTNNNYRPAEPLIVSKAPGWNCWGNKIKDPKPLDANCLSQDPDEIIYAQPNHQAGSTMTSITNPSAILKQYPKPLSKGEIVMWLKEGEIHRAGLLLNYGQSHHHAPVLCAATTHTTTPILVSWFFGLISRHQAEKYLHGQPPGTFLVRISTRIWGYTLSYQGTNGRTKHFLISAVNPAVPATLQANTEAVLPPQTGKQQRMSPFVPQGRYAFIGTNMTPYGTLVSLIRHHSHAPITKLGGEKLLNPCPGGPQVAGLENLFK